MQTYDAAVIPIRPGRVAQTREFSGGNLVAEYDREGLVLSIKLRGILPESALEAAMLDRFRPLALEA